MMWDYQWLMKIQHISNVRMEDFWRYKIGLKERGKWSI